jgi:uncharacterized SAM-binding protein YcdF (DUF218 family)
MSRRLRFWGIFFVALIAWALLAPFLATNLVVHRPLANADAILVLSGSAVYKERAKKAAELYKQGVSSVIIISDDGQRAGWLSGEKGNPRYVELEQRELFTAGIPKDAVIVLPGRVAGTDEEAKSFASKAEELNVTSLLVVTSAYHTRRSLWTFEKILTSKGVVIGIDSPPPGDRTPGPWYWWLTPRGWQTVAFEYVKMAVYYAYY